jgi:proteasome accessory factor A
MLAAYAQLLFNTPMSEAVLPRLMGTETEFNPVLVSRDGEDSLLETDKLALPDGVVERSTFLSNGGRFYSWSQIPEYSTPECISFADVVYSEEVGEQFMLHALQEYIDNHRDIARASLHKRTATTAFYEGDSSALREGCAIRSWGYHENYLTSRKSFRAPLTWDLVKGHLATRNVLVGSGFWWPTPQDITRVLPSQKLTDIVAETSSDTTKSKPLLNTRDEPHANQTEWARLHITSGDSNIAPWSSWLKFGTTSLVLRLAETGYGKKIEDYLPQNVLRATTQIARLGNLATFTNRRGRTMRAIDQQELFAEAGLDLAEHVALPEEEKAVLKEWHQAIDDFKKDPALLAERTEWIGRWKWLEAVAERTSRADKVSALRDADKLWDKLYPIPGPDAATSNGIGFKKRAKMVFPGYDPLGHEALVQEAPEGTRAALRAEYVRLHHSHQNVEINWSRWGSKRDVDPYALNAEHQKTA